jgi:hypothetical protein
MLDMTCRCITSPVVHILLSGDRYINSQYFIFISSGERSSDFTEDDGDKTNR